MPFTGPIEDRQAIRDLYDTAADASSRGDRDTWMACYAEEGCEWNTHIFNCSGKVEIASQWDQLCANFEKVGFISQVGSIEVTGDSAHARITAQEIIRLKDGKIYKLIGLYRDNLVRINGQWRLTRRDYEPLVEEEPR